MENNPNNKSNDEKKLITSFVVLLVFGLVLISIGRQFITRMIKVIRDSSETESEMSYVMAIVSLVIIGVIFVAYLCYFIAFIRRFRRIRRKNIESSQREHTYQSHSAVDMNFGLSKDKCPKCGADIHEGDAFCSGCGYSFDQQEVKSPFAAYASQAEEEHDLYHEEIPTAIGKLNRSPSFGMVVSFQWFKDPVGQVVAIFMPLFFTIFGVFLLLSKKIVDNEIIVPIALFIFAFMIVALFILSPLGIIRKFNQTFLGKSFLVYADRIVIKDGEEMTIQPNSIVIRFSDLDKFKETDKAFFLVYSKEFRHDGSFKKDGYLIPKDELSSSAVSALSYRLKALKNK